MAYSLATRQGKRELGPYAEEERMPERLLDTLNSEDDSNTLHGVIPRLSQLESRDPDLEVVYLCSDAAVQVHKLADEGPHFCGYRNMQMLNLSLSKTVSAKTRIDGKPSVPQLQRMIEKAWSRGFNAHGRVQTGGIKDTRKHVGTSEAEALFLSLDISCTGSAYHGKDAWRKVLDHVELYFSNAAPSATGVIATTRPAVFLQRPKHSVTIIGLERLKSGKRRLLIFDPAWNPPSIMRGEMAGLGGLRWNESLALRRYRQSERSLKRFNAFETLTIDCS